jgi:hypothetical protein
MSGEGGLERRYRRLLVLYPAAHRSAHEQEMLGVLMTGARAGQRLPGLAESADLIWGALRIRLRPGRRGAGDPGWGDALAVVSVVLPVFFLVYFASATLANLSGFLLVPRIFAGQLLARAALATLVLLGLRRTAAVAARALLVWFAVAAMTLASPLSRRIMALLAIPLYYWAVGFVVPPSFVTRPDIVISGWEGPLRVTLTCLPVIALMCLAVAALLRSAHHLRRPPAS